MIKYDFRQILYRNLAAIVVCLLFAAAAHAQVKQKPVGGPPLLWERQNIGKQDLFYGPGGRGNQPDASRFTFIKEETGGHSKKYRVKDG